MKHFSGLLVFGLLIGPGSWSVALGAENSTAPARGAVVWDLSRCLTYVFESNPSLKAAMEGLRAVEGQNKILTSEFVPKLSSTYSFQENNASLQSLSGRSAKDLPPTSYSNDVYSWSFSLSDTLYSKRRSPTYRYAESTLSLAESKIRQLKNDLVMNTKKAFYAVLFTEQSFKITEAAESVARDNYSTSEALFKEGKVSSFDVSRAKVRWISAKADVLAARNAHAIALEALKSVLSLPRDENLAVTGKFPEPLEGAVDIDYNIGEALKFRPEVEQMEILGSLKKDALDLAKAGYFPSLNGSLSYSFASPDLDLNFPDQYKAWSAMLSVSIPIFDGFLTQGKYQAAQSEANQVSFNQESVEDTIVMEIRQAAFSLKNTLESLAAQKESVDTASENLQIARERYGMGLLSQLELKDVELSLISAQTQYTKTLYDYHLSLISLERAKGLPYRPAEEVYR